MQEEFYKLYDYIVNSEDPEKMHVLGSVTKSMMARFIESYPQWAREYLDTLQAVKWDNYLTAKEATKIIDNMVPKPLWSETAWKGLMTNLNLPMEEEPKYNKEALRVTMAMICSDSGDTLKGLLGITNMENGNREKLFEAIYKLAIDKLTDRDKMFNIRSYFKV